ncbi:MAG: hypothetical protein ACR2K6_02905 [Solirubrobacterales bacterium]
MSGPLRMSLLLGGALVTAGILLPTLALLLDSAFSVYGSNPVVTLVLTLVGIRMIFRLLR